MRTKYDQSPEPETPAQGFWLRWRMITLALAVVLALPAARQVYNWYDKSRDAANKRAARDTTAADLAKIEAEQRAARDAARAELDKATAAEQELTKKHQDELQKARKVLEDKDFSVRLTGPAHIQPGAPNSWTIETLNRHGDPIKPKKLEVVVKDAKGTELDKKTHERPTSGSTTLDLSLAFWAKVKPGTELFVEVSALTDDDRKGVLSELIPLARPVFVTHLATDKPLYKPGETVRFRSLTLDRAALTPPGHDLILKFQLRDPGDAITQLDTGNGRLLSNFKPVLGPDGKPLRGIGVGEYTIPVEAPGGEYKLDLLEIQSGTGRQHLLETRKFIVNRYVPDTFEKKLEFDGKSYGAGATVKAHIEVSRTAGGPMKDAKATVTATVDGKSFYELKNTRFDIVPAERGATKGVLDVTFELPRDLFDNAKATPPSATLSLNIQDGSDAEPIVRPIPLVAKNLNVEFFPEGGDLIDGTPGRVYFMVRMPSVGTRDLSPAKPGFTAAPGKSTEPGKPADLKGYITDGMNKVVDVETLTDAVNPGVNRGHGIFDLTPKAGTKYFLKITEPKGIAEPTKDGFPLPATKADGVALTALDAITNQGAAIRVRLQSPTAKTLHVGAYARGRLVAHNKLDVTAGTAFDVALKSDDNAGGVTRVTVFEEPNGAAEGRAALIPRAERLVFRKPDQELILNVQPDKTRYSPSGKVRLELSAITEKKEQPTPAVLLVGVVNRSVITMADNKTDRLMPTHFLLSGEVKHPAELEHADFLLTEHPQAAVALDRLLGTQGWRRFAEQNADDAKPVDTDVDKMLVAHGQRTSAPFALYKLEEQRVNAEFRPKLEQVTIARSLAEADWNQRNGAVEATTQLNAAKAAATDAEAKYDAAASELYKHETRPTRPLSWGLPALAVMLFAVGIGGAALTASRPRGERRPYYFGTFLLFAVGALTVGAVAQSWATTDAEVAWKTTNDQKKKEAAADEDRLLAKRADRPNAMPQMAAEAAFDGAPPRGAAPPPMAPPAPGGAFPQLEPKPEARPAGDKGMAKGFDDKEQLKFDDFAKNRVMKEAKVGDRKNEMEKMRNALAQMGDRPAPRPAPVMPGRPGGFPGGPAAGKPGFPGGGGFGPGGLAPQPVVTPFVVREYAHQRDPALGEVRSDFTETVYWHPVLVLPENGKSFVEFQLSDDIARYEVLVAGHTLDGRIGAITKTIEARQAFSIDPKLPLQVSHTDIIDVPLRVTNDIGDARKVTFGLTMNGLKADGPLPDFLELAAGKTGRKMFRLKADTLSGDGVVTATGTSGDDKDVIRRTIKVVPDGFPGVGSVSDTLEKGRAAGTVRLPKDVIAGTLKVRLEVYPTSMADLVKGLDGLLREPYGCFEQTSTSNYPNAMILDYMKQTNQTNPQAEAKAKGLLDKGYSKLISFECPDTPEKVRQGFEWFGATDQQHEALTAYGLLQFKDMARVHTVDPALIKRTQSYLMSRRDGQGGFKRNPRALDQFGGAPDHTTNAYIVWALVESDPDNAESLDLTKEIQALKTQALDEATAGGKDAYFLALVANVLSLRSDRDANKILDRIKDKHAKAGAVTGAQTSITRSGGRTLEIETTALTLLGWLRANDPKYGATIKDSIKWLGQQRGGYGAYGSTQSTILALKALTLYAKKSAHPSESGEIRVLVGGKVVGTRKFSEKDVEVIGLDIENAEEVFKGGETEVEIVTDAKQPYPFALSYAYTSRTPVSAEKCAVAVSTKLAKSEAGEGDAVPLHVTVENKLDKGHGMVVAIVGIPAGMKVPTDMKELTALREKGTIAYFETRDRELILYWRSMAPKQKIDVEVSLVCDVPGEYRGPASRAYLYYDADHKHWVEPLAVKITPAK